MTEAALLSACALARAYEGCSLTPYRDPTGIPTIGYGATYLTDGVRVTMETPPISQEDADLMLEAEMQRVADGVDKLVLVRVNDNQCASLYDFTFNLGLMALQESTLLRLLNSRYYDAAALQFPRWVYAGGRILPGLVRRRHAEQALYLTPIEP